MDDGRNAGILGDEVSEIAAGARPPEEVIVRGGRLRRKDLHNTWGGVRQGGVSPSVDSPNVFLFSDPVSAAAHGYRADRWSAPDLFEYCGEGQRGHQRIDRYNGSILRAAAEGKTLQLFFGWRGTVEYGGPFRLDASEPYYFDTGKDVELEERRVVVFRLRPVGFEGPAGGSGDDADIDRLVDVRTLVGSAYRGADESIRTTTDRLPFSVDPDEQDRGLRSHAMAQNLLAAWLRERGFQPLSPGPGDPAFDLAFCSGDRKFVIEVKSIIPSNEVGQMRLGIGQCLDYMHQLGAEGVVFVDRRPTSDRWLAIAARIGIRLLWPAALQWTVTGWPFDSK